MKNIIINLFSIALWLFILGCASENKDWENAKKENSIISYKNFLKLHPEGVFADSASLLLEELHFYEAQSINTIKSYADFLKSYPEGVYTDSASLLYEYNKAKQVDSIETYENFLKKYPDSEYASEVKDRILVMRYDLAKKEATKQAYSKFLDYYPDSKYSDEIKGLLFPYRRPVIEGEQQEKVQILKGVEVWVDCIDHKGDKWEHWKADKGYEIVLMYLKLKAPESLSKFEVTNIKVTDKEGNEYKMVVKVGNSMMTLNSASCKLSKGEGGLLFHFTLPKGKVLNKLYLEEVSFDLSKIQECKM